MMSGNSNVNLGVHQIKEDKPLYRELSRISGLGVTSSLVWLDSLGVDCYKITWNELKEEEKVKIAKSLESEKIPGLSYPNGNRLSEHLIKDSLKSAKATDIRFHIKIADYRGQRHKIGKRVRGQRTRTTNRKNKLIKGFQKLKNKKKQTINKDV